MTRRIAPWLILAVLLILVPRPGEALSRKVILQLKKTAATRYPQGRMEAYTVMTVKGKAYASTRGPVAAVPTVAVWELDGGIWQWVFDHPARPTDRKAVNLQYRNYGFTWKQQARLQKNWKKFPG